MADEQERVLRIANYVQTAWILFLVDRVKRKSIFVDEEREQKESAQSDSIDEKSTSRGVQMHWLRKNQEE